METDQVRQFKQLQEENARLKRLVAELSLDKTEARQVIECWRREYNWVSYLPHLAMLLRTGFPLVRNQVLRVDGFLALHAASVLEPIHLAARPG